MTCPIRLLFPAHPFERGAIEPDYAAEVGAADGLGLARSLVQVEPLLERADGAAAVRRVAEGAGEPALYRGWMLSPDQYAALHAALTERGLAPVTSPAAYRHTHWLPESYAAIERWTAPSAWLPVTELTVDRAVALARTFGPRPLVVKDYVKSRKHEWFDACFIPFADDEANVRRVVENFLRLQDGHVVGGLVFREFVDFARIGLHAKSRLPLVREYRFFVLDGRPFFVAPYWAEGQYGESAPSADVLAAILPRVKSRFYAADVAEKSAGGWMLVELNDGGSAGVPEGGSPEAFYRSLGAAAG